MNEENKRICRQTPVFYEKINGRTRSVLTMIVLVVMAGVALWACATYFVGGAHSAKCQFVFLFDGSAFSRDEIIRMETAFAAATLKNYRVAEGKVEIPAGQRDQYILALQKHDALPHGVSLPLDAGSRPGLLPPTGRELEHQRIAARQNSLARQIERFRGIESAQVMLDFQQNTVGLTQVRVATASVVVRSRPNVNLQQSDIQAIRGTVMGSVADLRAENLVIVDSRVNRCWSVTEEGGRYHAVEEPHTAPSEGFVNVSAENENSRVLHCFHSQPLHPQGSGTYSAQKIRTLDDATMYVLRNGNRHVREETESEPVPILPITDAAAIKPPAENIQSASTSIVINETKQNAKNTASPRRNLHLREAGIGVLIFAVTGFFAALFGNSLSGKKKRETTDKAILDETTLFEARHKDGDKDGDLREDTENPKNTQEINDASEPDTRATANEVIIITEEEPAAPPMPFSPVEQAASEMKVNTAPEKKTMTEENTAPEKNAVPEVAPPESRGPSMQESLFASREETRQKAMLHEGVRLEQLSRFATPSESTPSESMSPEPSSREPMSQRKSLRDLKAARPEHVAEVLRGERPQVSALVLRHVGKPQAKNILSHFSTQTQKEITTRLEECGHTDEEILNDVLDSVAARVYALEPAKGVPTDPPLIPAAEPQSMPEPEIHRMPKMHSPRQASESLTFTLPEGMIFDDLVYASDDTLRRILDEASAETAMYGFLASGPQLQERFLGVMPVEYASRIRHCAKEIGPMRVCDLEEARHQVMALIARLAAENQIELPTKLHRRAA